MSEDMIGRIHRYTGVHRAQIRAVIEAMHTPLAAMLQAGADQMPDMDRASESYAVASDDAGNVWAAMISAALNTHAKPA